MFAVKRPRLTRLSVEPPANSLAIPRGCRYNSLPGQRVSMTNDE